MRTFRNIPIKQKLVVIIMGITAAALLLAGFGIVLTDSVLFRGYLRRDLSALASIIADNSTAALAFNDPNSAAETLGALRARPHVVGACIYRPNGTILARYSRKGSSGCPPADGQAQIRFTSQGVIVSQPILLSGRRIGTLMLLYDLGEISERITLYGSTVFAVLLASSLLAFALASQLRAVIATPISQLVRATTSVSETGDYSTRAEKLSGDELGVLVDRFNEMLAGIQSRDEGTEERAGTVSLYGGIHATKNFHRDTHRRCRLFQSSMAGVHRTFFYADQELGLDAIRSSRRPGRKRARLAALH